MDFKSLSKKVSDANAKLNAKIQEISQPSSSSSSQPTTTQAAPKTTTTTAALPPNPFLPKGSKAAPTTTASVPKSEASSSTSASTTAPPSRPTLPSQHSTTETSSSTSRNPPHNVVHTSNTTVVQTTKTSDPKSQITTVSTTASSSTSTSSTAPPRPTLPSQHSTSSSSFSQNPSQSAKTSPNSVQKFGFQIPTTETVTSIQTTITNTPKDLAVSVWGEGKPVPASIPSHPLSNPDFLKTLRVTEVLVSLTQVNIYKVISPFDRTLVGSNSTLTISKTSEDTVICLSVAPSFCIFSSLIDRPSFSPYFLYYLFSEPVGNVTNNPPNLWLLELSGESKKEDVDKLEIMFLYYTSFYRILRPCPIEEEDDSPQEVDKYDATSSKIETGGRKVADGIVSGGHLVGKAAHKVSDVYKSNTKAYEGPEMTEEQKTQLQEDEVAKSESGTQKFVQGTAAVVGGFTKGLGWVGSTSSKAVQSTSWYKEREERQKKEKEEKERLGIKDESEGKKKVVVSSVRAVKTVVGGVEKGIVVSAEGIRDASVDATKHKSGDYAAAQSRQKWNTAGNVAVSTVNIASLVSVGWLKAAIYVGGGAVSYDPNQASYLDGAIFKEGWLSVQKDIYSGSGWESKWVVLRSTSITFYRNPALASEKKHDFFWKLSEIRKVTKSEDTVQILTNKTKLEKNNSITKLNASTSTTTTSSMPPYSFYLATVDSLNYFSTRCADVDYTNEKFVVNEEQERESWLHMIACLSYFQVPSLSVFSYDGIEVNVK